ncbi:MAG TPA: hypothetical protein VHJ34_00795 [Actinomycetota bacterium]|nr:hypothetical protein [Actinomycetota bacterium]
MANLLTNPFGGDGEQAVDLKPFRFTSFMGGAGTLSAATSAVILVAEEVLDKKYDTAIKVALLGVIGLSIVAAALASAGDALARAYAAGNVSRGRTDKEPSRSALEAAVSIAVDALKGAPERESRSGVVALPDVLAVTSKNRAAKAVATRVDDKGKLEYLLGTEGGQLSWHPEDDVALAMDPPREMTISLSPPLSVAVQNITGYIALAVRSTAEDVTGYLVVRSGEDPSWRSSEVVNII